MDPLSKSSQEIEQSGILPNSSSSENTEDWDDIFSASIEESNKVFEQVNENLVSTSKTEKQNLVSTSKTEKQNLVSTSKTEKQNLASTDKTEHLEMIQTSQEETTGVLKTKEKAHAAVKVEVATEVKLEDNKNKIEQGHMEFVGINPNGIVLMRRINCAENTSFKEIAKQIQLKAAEAAPAEERKVKIEDSEVQSLASKIIKVDKKAAAVNSSLRNWVCISEWLECHV